MSYESGVQLSDFLQAEREFFLKKQVLVSLSISLLAVVSLLLLGLTLMEGRFFPGTRVNGVDLSLMKREEAEKYFSNWKTWQFDDAFILDDKKRE